MPAVQTCFHELRALGVQEYVLHPGIHATHHIHTFQVGGRAWHVLMYSDEVPRCVSDDYLRQLEAQRGKPL